MGWMAFWVGWSIEHLYSKNELNSFPTLTGEKFRRSTNPNGNQYWTFHIFLPSNLLLRLEFGLKTGRSESVQRCPQIVWLPEDKLSWEWNVKKLQTIKIGVQLAIRTTSNCLTVACQKNVVRLKHFFFCGKYPQTKWNIVGDKLSPTFCLSRKITRMRHV